MRVYGRRPRGGYLRRFWLATCCTTNLFAKSLEKNCFHGVTIAATYSVDIQESRKRLWPKRTA